MKNKCLVFALFLSLCNIIYSQNNSSFGINAGLVIPSIDHLKLMGYQFGGIGRFDIKRSSVQIATGFNYTMITGETVTYSWFYDDQTITEIVKYPSFKCISIYVGPQFSYKNAYILPEISCNSDISDSKFNNIFKKEHVRFGFSINNGVLLPVRNDNIKIDLCFKISLMNVIGKKEGEESKAVFQILAGILFNTP